jgi:hypothetical protein
LAGRLAGWPALPWPKYSAQYFGASDTVTLSATASAANSADLTFFKVVQLFRADLSFLKNLFTYFYFNTHKQIQGRMEV